MKQAKILSLVLLCCLYLLTSCGDAGVQIKVGGDYETEFNANQAGLEFAQTFNERESTTLNSEIREYGDFIKDLEVKSLVITVKNFSNTVDGNITLEANGIDFSSGNVTIRNGAVIPLTPDQSNGLTNLANSLRNSDVSIGLEMNVDAPFGDNDFDMELAITAFATVQVDE